ncbi:hypothetical protein QE152_g30353 [Popillia japonica]|uniref:Uncharacterized protein n=1 Tax=Popillia japonica TaxID=7064 RepID=A0AAW1JE59_POPJA
MALVYVRKIKLVKSRSGKDILNQALRPKGGDVFRNFRKIVRNAAKVCEICTKKCIEELYSQNQEVMEEFHSKNEVDKKMKCHLFY